MAEVSRTLERPKAFLQRRSYLARPIHSASCTLAAMLANSHGDLKRATSRPSCMGHFRGNAQVLLAGEFHDPPPPLPRRDDAALSNMAVFLCISSHAKDAPPQKAQPNMSSTSRAWVKAHDRRKGHSLGLALSDFCGTASSMYLCMYTGESGGSKRAVQSQHEEQALQVCRAWSTYLGSFISNNCPSAYACRTARVRTPAGLRIPNQRERIAILRYLGT